MKARMLVLVATVVGGLILGGGVVLAAGGTFGTRLIANGTIARSTDISANGIEFSSPGNAKVIVQHGDFTGAGTTLWHTHPGLTVVTVESGTITYHSRCQTTVYTAGKSFVEPPNTPVMAESAESAHVVTTLIVPAGMQPRTDVAPPDCTHSNDDERSG